MIEKDFLEGLGLDADTAGALAELIAEEAARLAAAQAQQLAHERQQQLPRLVSLTPGGATGYTAADYTGMSYAQRVRLQQTDPEGYRRLAGR